jgi:hypothetical protein
MLKAMIMAVFMVTLMAVSAAAATPVANWPYQANQSIRPGATVIVNADTSPGAMKITDGAHTAYVDEAGYLVTLDAAHSRVHDGIYYTYDQYDGDVDNGETMVVTIRTGATLTHMVASVTASLVGAARLYESPVFADTGTQDTGTNFKRDETYSSTIMLYDGSVMSSAGTTLSIALIGGGVANSRIGGQAREATEWLLKPNTYYVIEFTSLADNNAAVIDVEYYEANL